MNEWNVNTNGWTDESFIVYQKLENSILQHQQKKYIKLNSIKTMQSKNMQ